MAPTSAGPISREIQNQKSSAQAVPAGLQLLQFGLPIDQAFLMIL
jgi:hypothetical protein